MTDLGSLVRRLADRTRPRTEADVQADVRELLLHGNLNLGEEALSVQLETQVGDRRRIDVELGLTVIEVKKDLRQPGILADAELQLAGYVAARTRLLNQSYVGVLTDGCDWRCYHLQPDGRLLEVARYQVAVDQPDPSELCVWLEAILATREQIRPTPSELDRRIGSDSPGHALARAELQDLWASVRDQPEAQLKRRLWARLLTTAFGSNFTDDDRLFVEHTYLVLTSEVIAHAAVGLSPGSIPAASLVTGKSFADVGIHGVAEADFFDWVLNAEGGGAFIVSLARRLSRFDWTAVEHDVLKHLYESVIDERQRHQIGEYYTPDWLADKMVQDAVDDPLNQRVLDPSCGSGTFVFQAVRRFLSAADEAGLDSRTSLDRVTRSVFGVDIHPVAVILARVTYLLALSPARLQGDRGELAIPIYLGDSMQWQIDRTVTRADQLIIYTDDERGLFTEELIFPATVIADPARFDSLVREMTDLACQRERGSRHPSAKAIFRRYGVSDEDQKVLAGTFALLCDLHDYHRDHIWGYYARNLARPLWLQREESKVDVVIGNPPWLAYRFMTREMKAAFREQSKARRIWAGAKVATHQDLSAYFVVRSMELYLRPGGKFRFVMPLAVLSRLAYEGFRSGSYGDGLQVAFDQPWDLEGIRPPLFPVPSSVVGGTFQGIGGRRLGEACRRWSGRLPRGHASSWSEVEPGLSGEEVKIVMGDQAPASPYHVRFSQGATIVPRVLHVVEDAPVASGLGLAANLRMVRSKRSSLEKPPWKHLPDRGPTSIEAEFIFKLHLGTTVLPYRLLPAELVVLPVLTGRLMDGKDPRIDGSPRLAQWWREGEALWEEHKAAATEITLVERLDYQRTLTQQLLPSPTRVVYSASGNTLTAAVLSDRNALVEHKLYWASCETLAEARFLVAILNSTVLTKLVEPLQSKGLFGPRDFDKYVFHVPIPLYDSRIRLHRDIVSVAASAEEVASAVLLPERLDFKAVRSRVRAALRDDGVGERIELLVGELLSGA